MIERCKKIWRGIKYAVESILGLGVVWCLCVLMILLWIGCIFSKQCRELVRMIGDFEGRRSKGM